MGLFFSSLFSCGVLFVLPTAVYSLFIMLFSTKLFFSFPVSFLSVYIYMTLRLYPILGVTHLIISSNTNPD
jgi:hypothetical protein